VVKATLVIGQWYFVVCGIYFVNSNNSYSAMLLSCMWCSLWLEKH